MGRRIQDQGAIEEEGRPPRRERVLTTGRAAEAGLKVQPAILVLQFLSILGL